MGKNNNNVGMHFVRYTHYGNEDNLSYYDKKSDEAIFNLRSECEASLARTGDYIFAKLIGNLRIENGERSYSMYHNYKVYSYDKHNQEHAEEIERVSIRQKLLPKNGVENIEIKVHKTYSTVYIDSSLEETLKDIISKRIICKMIDVWK